MYHRQPNEATPAPSPWITGRVANLVAKRDSRGRRVLQDIHARMLILLQARYPDSTAPVLLSDPEVAALLDCSESSVRRVRSLLVDHRLLEWSEPGPDGRRTLSPVAPDQPLLPLAAEPVRQAHNAVRQAHNADSRVLSARESACGNQTEPDPSPTPPPQTPLRSSTVLGADSKSPTKETRESTARMSAQEKSREASPSEWDAIREQLKDRRREVVGRAWLPEREDEQFRGLFEAGGTLLDLDEALEEWRALVAEGRAPTGLHGWRYVCSMVRGMVEQRNKPFEPKAQPEARAESERRDGAMRSAPGWRGRGSARQETMAEQHERLMRELEESRGNGNGRRGF